MILAHRYGFHLMSRKTSQSSGDGTKKMLRWFGQFVFKSLHSIVNLHLSVEMRLTAKQFQNNKDLLLIIIHNENADWHNVTLS